jgi:hypothetical protein
MIILRNLLGENINTVKRSAENVLVTINEIFIKVNAEKNNCIIVAPKRTAERNSNIKTQ